jgi:hypothetical protein
MSGKVDTSVSARILGWHVNTVLKWRRLGKIKSASRKSSAKQSPWIYDREEIEGLKNASHQ